jgi:hypothetical protein
MLAVINQTQAARTQFKIAAVRSWYIDLPAFSLRAHNNAQCGALAQANSPRPVRSITLAPITSKVDVSAMREFLLLPAYAACFVLAVVALAFMLAGLLLATAVFGPILLCHAVLVTPGARPPAMPTGHEPWWSEDAECFLACSQRLQQ